MPPTWTHLLHRLTAPPAADTDGDLLDRFARLGDEAAFATLMGRHAPMVMGVCRRILRDGHAAEDASQATFLILARKAGSVGRPDALAGWLYGVAYRVALKARGSRHRLGRLPVAAVANRADPGADPLSQVSARDLLEMLEAELHRLPEAYRLPLVLCCLDGLSQEEAARRLGCSAAAIRGRLERGRKRLHLRLARRGLPLTAALAAALATRGAASASLVGPAARAALAFATGGGAAVVSDRVIFLAKGGLQAMFWNKVKVALVVGALCGLVCTGAGWLAVGAGQSNPTGAAEGVAPVAPADPGAKTTAGEGKAREGRLREQLKEQGNLLQDLNQDAEKAEDAMSDRLVKARQELMELEEQLREAERRWRAASVPSARENRLEKEEERLMEEIDRIKAAALPGEARSKQIEQREKQIRAKRADREELAQKRLYPEGRGDRTRLRREVVRKEEVIRSLERKRDLMREQFNGRREAVVERIRQLEGGARAEPARLPRSLEQRLDAIHRELSELRRELRRRKANDGD